MRIRTLVPIALVAVLAIASLPTSHSQTSANAPQEYKLTLTKEHQVDSYLIERSRVVASRSFRREPIGKEIVDTGKDYFGVPYCWGGESARCFDCSGFIQYVYNKNGIEVPRTADQQLKSMTTISRDEAQEGDLVFFVYRNGYAHHVGIYVGNNTILHSPRPGRKVRLEKIWSTRVVFAREASMIVPVPVPPQAEIVLEDGINY
jgi:cell wall-associated NlpC family hydrolase